VTVSEVPLPPLELATRVGSGDRADPFEAYLREGAAVRRRIDSLLPATWSYEGKQILDFGCGAARVLRNFFEEADRGQFWGCDIDGSSVAWINAKLNPPLRAFRNDLAPPLDIEEDFFDLVYATSVFTHIGELWSDWLLELHRVLRPGGILIATFLGDGMWQGLVGEPYPEDEVGMTVMRHWTGQDAWVFHSEWWLREHWGRVFDVDTVMRPPRDDAGATQVTHSYIAATERAVPMTTAQLERCDPAEPREVAGLQTNVRLLRRELDEAVEQRPAVPDLPAALRQAVLASPVGGPARSVHRSLRRRR
jgi:SAM-dependent methyltransferase